MAIKYLDMFAGIGGFRSGLEKIGGSECIGYCEIDKYAKQSYEAMYDTKGELYFNDARKINPKELPDIDLITGGFPCQSFSIAGRRKGFEDTRGTLFFEIARIAFAKEPKYLFLENVPGLLSHDKAEHLKQSSVRWTNWGMMSLGRCLTAKISEFHNPEKDCILWDFLEPSVPDKYFLSRKQILKLLYKSTPEKKERGFILQREKV